MEFLKGGGRKVKEWHRKVLSPEEGPSEEGEKKQKKRDGGKTALLAFQDFQV